MHAAKPAQMTHPLIKSHLK